MSSYRATARPLVPVAALVITLAAGCRTEAATAADPTGAPTSTTTDMPASTPSTEPNVDEVDGARREVDVLLAEIERQLSGIGDDLAADATARNEAD